MTFSKYFFVHKIIKKCLIQTLKIINLVNNAIEERWI